MLLKVDARSIRRGEVRRCMKRGREVERRARRTKQQVKSTGWPHNTVAKMAE